MGSLQLHGIRKSFGATEVLKGVDLEVATGEFAVFVGPSGCGKSTLLRIIAGLDAQTAGDLRIDGRLMNGVPPARRGIAMVFQSYALYPHLTVARNMGLALAQEGVAKAEIDRRVGASAGMLRLDALLDRRPRSADVVADEDVEAYVLTAGDFDTLLREEPHLGQSLLATIARLTAQRLRATSDELRLAET